MKEKIIFNVIYLPENRGLGNALNLAIHNASYELIARMDSDDISLPNRFEEQIKLFMENNNLDVVGGYISEFIGTEDNIIGCREVKTNDVSIKKNMKKRCPMNHVSVIFKRSAVLSSGGYIDFPYNEDYYLWIRMMQHNYIFENLPNVVVNVRAGFDMANRRGGNTYYKSEKQIQKYMFKNHIISFPRYIINTFIRFIVEIVMTKRLRSTFFRIIRKKNNFSQSKHIKNNIINNEEFPKFSVAMSVYVKDNPEWFDKALKSISIDQSIKPAEIVLVVDGPVSDEILLVIEKYKNLLSNL